MADPVVTKVTAMLLTACKPHVKRRLIGEDTAAAASALIARTLVKAAHEVSDQSSVPYDNVAPMVEVIAREASRHVVAPDLVRACLSGDDIAPTVRAALVAASLEIDEATAPVPPAEIWYRFVELLPDEARHDASLASSPLANLVTGAVLHRVVTDLDDLRFLQREVANLLLESSTLALSGPEPPHFHEDGGLSALVNYFATRLPVLETRRDEIEDILQRAGPGRSLLVTGNSYVGKTVLATELCARLKAIEKGPVLSFFVRTATRDSYEEFIASVRLQIRKHLPDPGNTVPGVVGLHQDWQLLLTYARDRHEIVSLVIDGLDEQRSGERPILALVPPVHDEDPSRVICFARPQPRSLLALSQEHPLREMPEYLLNPCASSEVARADFDRLLHWLRSVPNPEQRMALAVASAAKGPISPQEVADVSGISLSAVLQLLSDPSLERHFAQLLPAIEFGHSEVRQVILSMYSHEKEQADVRFLEWGKAWIDSGWSEESPSYLRRSFFSHLAEARDLESAATLIANVSWRSRQSRAGLLSQAEWILRNPERHRISRHLVFEAEGARVEATYGLTQSALSFNAELIRESSAIDAISLALALPTPADQVEALLASARLARKEDHPQFADAVLQMMHGLTRSDQVRTLLQLASGAAGTSRAAHYLDLAEALVDQSSLRESGAIIAARVAHVPDETEIHTQALLDSARAQRRSKGVREQLRYALHGVLARGELPAARLIVEAFPRTAWSAEVVRALALDPTSVSSRARDTALLLLTNETNERRRFSALVGVSALFSGALGAPAVEAAVKLAHKRKNVDDVPLIFTLARDAGSSSESLLQLAVVLLEREVRRRRPRRGQEWNAAWIERCRSLLSSAGDEKTVGRARQARPRDWSRSLVAEGRFARAELIAAVEEARWMLDHDSSLSNLEDGGAEARRRVRLQVALGVAQGQLATRIGSFVQLRGSELEPDLLSPEDRRAWASRLRSLAAGEPDQAAAVRALGILSTYDEPELGSGLAKYVERLVAVRGEPPPGSSSEIASRHIDLVLRRSAVKLSDRVDFRSWTRRDILAYAQRASALGLLSEQVLGWIMWYCADGLILGIEAALFARLVVGASTTQRHALMDRLYDRHTRQASRLLDVISAGLGEVRPIRAIAAMDHPIVMPVVAAIGPTESVYAVLADALASS